MGTSGYYQQLVALVVQANLHHHSQRWYDPARRTNVTKHYFAYVDGSGKHNLIATARDSHDYPYEFEQEAIKAINTIRQFLSWV